MSDPHLIDNLLTDSLNGALRWRLVPFPEVLIITPLPGAERPVIEPAMYPLEISGELKTLSQLAALLTILSRKANPIPDSEARARLAALLAEVRL